MKVTKQDIARQFNLSINNVKQINSMQLFIVDDYSSLDNLHSNRKYLVSYRTIVGLYDFNNFTWYVTKEKFSVTTTRQINRFDNSIGNPVIRVDKEEFDKLVS